MQDFVTTAQLADLMEVPEFELPDSAQLYLDAAMASVRGYLQQELTLHSDDVVKLDGSGRRRLRLRERPVRAVTAVSVGEDVLDTSAWEVRGSTLYRIDGGFFPRGQLNITVTYDHGWDTDDYFDPENGMPIPADIVLVTLNNARRRLLAGGDTDETLQSETIGQYAYQTDAAQAAAKLALSAGEMATLDMYAVRLYI